MLVDSITSVLEELVEQGAGGNLLIANTGGATDNIAAALDEQVALGNAENYGIINTYNTRLTEYYDASAGQTSSAMANRVRAVFNMVDGRTITSNLPELDLIVGRNLDPALDTGPDAEGYWPAVIARRGEGENNVYALVDVGDRITVTVEGDRENPVKLEIVGVGAEGVTFGEAAVYTPLDAFEGRQTCLLYTSDAADE